MHIFERPRNLSPRRRHLRARVLSEYFDGALDIGDRVAVEAHVRDCARCRRLLDSLAGTIRSLGSLSERSPTGVADSIIAALHSDSPAEIRDPPRSSLRSDMPALTIVHDSDQRLAGDGPNGGWPRSAIASLRYCLRVHQLRLTAPIALLAGVVLSLANQTRMVMHAPIELATWVMCAPNFVVPFIALNMVLLVVLRVPRRTPF